MGDVRRFERPISDFDRPWTIAIIGILLTLSGALIVHMTIGEFGNLAAKFGGLLIVAAFGLYYRAWEAARAPRVVFVGDGGLVLVDSRCERALAWADLAHAYVGISFVTKQPFLVVYDALGRKTTRLSSDFPEFLSMSELICDAIARNRVVALREVPLERNWGLATLQIVGGVVLAAGVGYLFIKGVAQFVDRWHLDQVGVSGSARITELYERENGRAQWVAYEILEVEKSVNSERRAMMEETVWKMLSVGQSVGVVYVPDDPTNSSLTNGERTNMPLVGWLIPLTIFFLLTTLGVMLLGKGLFHLLRLEIVKRPAGFGWQVQEEPWR